MKKIYIFPIIFTTLFISCNNYSNLNLRHGIAINKSNNLESKKDETLNNKIIPKNVVSINNNSSNLKAYKSIAPQTTNETKEQISIIHTDMIAQEEVEIDIFKPIEIEILDNPNNNNISDKPFEKSPKFQEIKFQNDTNRSPKNKINIFNF